ncbi:hypothetical protein Taro_050433 [Colocasia esculenta]|uniref:Secreted protein n=1 Tax=Colocasia esculenta TaxID=4460 RepID=A0A843XDV0_COLES|nr:hypothetical protein [Colocasia esculenta]
MHSSQHSLSLLLTTHGATATSATRPTPSSRDDESLAEGSRGASTRSRAHKKNNPGPRTHHEVGKPCTPVPPRTGTQEQDYGTERTPK